MPSLREAHLRWAGHYLRVHRDLQGRYQSGGHAIRQDLGQFDQDWQRARAEAVRDLANDLEHHGVCRSARCRRARRCAGTNADCRRLAERELQPEELQPLAEEVYLRLQQERRAAAYGAAKPNGHWARDAVITNMDETQRAQQPVWYPGSPPPRRR